MEKPHSSLLPFLEHSKRIVIKIGSSLLVDSLHQRLREPWFHSLIDDIAWLIQEQQKEVIIVTSGAVALGRHLLPSLPDKLRINHKQAAAACGQIALISHYRHAFSQYQQTIAQVLLSIEDSENRSRYINAKNTLETLLRLHTVPVINENDTVATDELRFGDNDRLAARVSQMVSADLMILFSDIDGLYTANPFKDPSAIHIPQVDEISHLIEAMADGATSQVGSGGMITKISAAKIATRSGCHMVICSGKPDHPIRALYDNAKYTLFPSQSTPQSARKHWIASVLHPVGAVTIDAGACNALLKGSSLLPVGITEVEGNFDCGDVVSVKDKTGKEIARGLANYRHSDARLLTGKRSQEIESLMGLGAREEFIHRDDLVLL